MQESATRGGSTRGRSMLRAMLLLLPLTSGTALAGRPLAADDWYRFLAVSDLQLAADGGSVVYLLTRFDKESDRSRGELWTVSWAGGDARQLSHLSGEISEYGWSPDGKHLVLAVRTTDAAKTPRPIVIDALQFKEDGSGYRHAGLHTALWRLEVEKGDTEPLT